MGHRKAFVCSVEGCKKPHEARGYCPSHYRRFKLYGDPLGKAQRVYDLECSAEDCGRPRRAGAWCTLHYQRVAKYGDPSAVRYHTTVDRNSNCAVDGCVRVVCCSQGLCEAHYKRWRTYGDTDSGINAGRVIDKTGYVRLSGLKGHPFAAGAALPHEHRFVMATLLDRPLLSSESVHHRNGDRTDNRPENLELWSRSQPSGQRVEDKVRWAREILAFYGEMFPTEE